MLVNIIHNAQKYVANLTHPLDISIPIQPTGINAWDVENMQLNPVKSGEWVGDVTMGSSVNFNTILFNPHAHATHTECVGHISPNKESLNQELSTFFFVAELISIVPEKKNGDFIITKALLKKMIKKSDNAQAIIIRTIPNNKEKTIICNILPSAIAAIGFVGKILTKTSFKEGASVDSNAVGRARSIPIPG